MEVFYVNTNKVFSTRKEFVEYLLTSKVGSYFDEACKQKQCESGRFRSVTEIHQIVMSRFPKTSFMAMLRIISELIDEKKGFAMIWCTQVNKVVLKYMSNNEMKYISNYSRSHYYESVGVDGYSLKDYEGFINKIKNKQ